MEDRDGKPCLSESKHQLRKIFRKTFRSIDTAHVSLIPYSCVCSRMKAVLHPVDASNWTVGVTESTLEVRIVVEVFKGWKTGVTWIRLKELSDQAIAVMKQCSQMMLFLRYDRKFVYGKLEHIIDYFDPDRWSDPVTSVFEIQLDNKEWIELNVRDFDTVYAVFLPLNEVARILNVSADELWVDFDKKVTGENNE